MGGRRLTGGVTSSVHRLAIEDRGRRVQVVLRRWLDKVDSDDRVTREREVLDGLAASDIPAPEVLAADPTGSHAGVPAVLMTRVPGHMELSPRDPAGWLRQIVSLLVRIHHAPVVGAPVLHWLDERQLTVPGWSQQPKAWQMLVARLQQPPPKEQPAFIHHDYQHFNMLWQRDRLTGIVDWVDAGSGPPAVDVGHCRLNLAVLYSPELAEEFRVAYEAEAGRRVDPYWDLNELAWFDERWATMIPIQIGGRRPFDVAGLFARIDALVAAAVRRL